LACHCGLRLLTLRLLQISMDTGALLNATTIWTDEAVGIPVPTVDTQGNLYVDVKSETTSNYTYGASPDGTGALSIPVDTSKGIASVGIFMFGPNLQPLAATVTMIASTEAAAVCGRLC